MAPDIRTADPALDADAVAAIYAPAVLTSYASFEEVPPTAAEMADRMRRVLVRTPWLVAERDGTLVGYAYATNHRERAGYRWAVDVSVYVDTAHHGNGIGRALYDELMDRLRAQGFVNAYAGIALPNPASVALHEGIGMRRIGTYERVGWKLGRWVDVAWFGMRLAEPNGPPLEPILPDMDDPKTFRGMQVCGFAHPGSELRRELVELVLAGTKTATAGLRVEMDLDGDMIPTPGLREAVIGADGWFVGVIETTECRILRMADVDDDFARDEGEGFADAAAWRAAHERFWNAYLDELRDRLGDPDWSLTDDTEIVCQRFRVVERLPAP